MYFRNNRELLNKSIANAFRQMQVNVIFGSFTALTKPIDPLTDFKRHSRNFYKAPHLQANPTFANFLQPFPVLHLWESLLYRSQTNETLKLSNGPSPTSASGPPRIDSPRSEIFDPLPPKSSVQENPIVSEPVVSRVTPAIQFR